MLIEMYDQVVGEKRGWVEEFITAEDQCRGVADGKDAESQRGLRQ